MKLRDNLLFITLFLTVLGITSLSALGQSTHPNFEAISFLQENGVIKDDPTKDFRPEKLISRAEFFALLFPTFFYDEPKGKNCFRDVKKQWFAKYICQAKTWNILQGSKKDSFQPHQPISFFEAAKIIVNSLGVTTSPPLEAYILAAKRAIPLTITSFNKKLTRGETAEILYRVRMNKNDPRFVTRTPEEIEKWQIPISLPTPITAPPQGSPPIKQEFSVMPAGKYPYSLTSRNFKSYFDDDPIAEKIMSGEMEIDMFDYDVIRCYEENDDQSFKAPPGSYPVKEPYGEKILNGLRQIGYQFSTLCDSQTEAIDFLKAIFLFQKEHSLPYSTTVDAPMLRAIDKEVRTIEERDRKAAKDFICYEYMAKTPEDNIAKEHVAFLWKTAIDMFSQRFRIQKKDCLHPLFFNAAKDAPLICPSSYYEGYYGNECRLLRFRPFSHQAISDYYELTSKIREQAYYIAEEFKDTINITEFYNISYDVTQKIEPGNRFTYYRMRPKRPYFPEDGSFPEDGPQWAEMKQHFFGNQAGSPLNGDLNSEYFTATEDFVTTVMMYVLHGAVFRDSMKDKPPLQKKYAWILKNIFDGKEFDTGDPEYQTYEPDLYFLKNGLADPALYVMNRPAFRWNYVLNPPTKRSFGQANAMQQEIIEEIKTLVEQRRRNRPKKTITQPPPPPPTLPPPPY